MRLSRERGAALVVALWFVSAVAAISVAFIGLTRNDRVTLSSQVEAVEARALLESGLARAAATLSALGGQQRPQPAYRWALGDGTITATITSEAGKVDLNTADAGLIQALAQAVELPPERAVSLAAAVVDWRDDNHARQTQGAEDREYEADERGYGAADRPFASVAELRYVLPVDPPTYARLAPFLTVYSGRQQPERRLASPTVRAAMAIMKGLSPAAAAKDAGAGAEKGQAGNGATSQGTGFTTPAGPSRPPQSGQPAAAAAADQAGGGGGGDATQIYSILLDAALPGGYEAHARAVIWLEAGQSGPPVRILDWAPALTVTDKGS